MNGYNFTERVRKVLAMAREEAARLHHEYVGTEHILLGLIREGEGVAAHGAPEPQRRAGRDPAEDRRDGQEGQSRRRRPVPTFPIRRAPRRCSSWR